MVHIFYTKFITTTIMPTINKPTKRYKQIPYKHDRQSEQYYNNKAWKHLRHWYITTHPICEECSKQGIVTPATEVHHIIPFLTGKTEQQRWQLFLDDNNLMSLCSKCHHNIHKYIRSNGCDISTN